MTKTSTIRHAIRYLAQAHAVDDEAGELQSLKQLDPGVRCAAYGLAKRMLIRWESIEVATAHLQAQLADNQPRLMFERVFPPAV